MERKRGRELYLLVYRHRAEREGPLALAKAGKAESWVGRLPSLPRLCLRAPAWWQAPKRVVSWEKESGRRGWLLRPPLPALRRPRDWSVKAAGEGGGGSHLGAAGLG